MHLAEADTQSHVLWNCTYHLVFVPKYRKKVLFGQVRARIGALLRELAKQKDIQIHEGTACPDHIHLVASIPPKYSVAYAVGFLKGKSAIRIHYECAKRRRLTIQKSFWGRGYFVRTVGISKEEITKYVKEQWKRDQFFDGPQLDLHWDRE